jgi:hypothetical protein
VIGILWVLLLISVRAEAAQLGRITVEVNFREGPNLSSRVFKRLPAGTEVQIVKEDQTGWYLVSHRGQRGFVHPRYIKLVQTQRFGKSRERIGMVLIFIGSILVAFYVFPMFPKLALLQLGSLAAVILGDLLFQLGMLYSAFSASVGLSMLLSFFVRKKKPRPSADEILRDLKKAA